MRVLILWAHEESPNLGVAALARGSEAIVRRAWPDAEITAVNFGARPEQFHVGTRRSMLRERLTGRYGMKRWLSQFDVVWDTRSGDSFTDIYGMERHRLMSTVYDMATAAGAFGILAPQTIGPFESAVARRLARRTLQRSTVVFSRDPVSETVADGLGRPVDDSVADLAFAIEPPAIDRTHDVLLNVSGLLWAENPHVDHLVYRSAIHDLIVGLRSAGRTVTLLAHVLDSPVADNDATVVRELARPGVETVIPSSLDEVRAVIGGSQLVIAARMHACLNAISLGVPALPMAYSRKFEPLFDSISWRHGIDLRVDGGHADILLSEASDTDGLRNEAENASATGRRSLDRVVERLKALV